MNLIKPETIANVVRLKVEEERQKTLTGTDLPSSDRQQEHYELVAAMGMVFAAYPSDHILEYIREHLSENLLAFYEEVVPLMSEAYLKSKKK